MTNYYIRAIFFFFLLFVAFPSVGQRINISRGESPINPFEDYSKCQTGFMRGHDTIFPAKFENLWALLVGDYNQIYGDVHYTNSDYYGSQRNRNNAWILSENGKFGCLSDNGKWILPCRYEELTFHGPSLQFIAKLNGKFGMVTQGDTVTVPFEFDKIEPTGISAGIYGPVFVTKDTLHGLYSAEGKEIIPAIYQSVIYANFGSFERGYIVTRNGKKGFLAEDGKIIIEPKYEKIELLEDWVRPEWNALYRVKDNIGRYAVFNENGDQLIPFEKSDVFPVYTYSSYSENRSVSFAERRDSLGKRQLVNLTNGITTDWRDGFKAIGDQILAYSFLENTYEIAEWQIIDTNFNLIYSNSGTKDQLFGFDFRNRLEEVDRLPGHDENEGLYLYYKELEDYFGSHIFPSIVTIKKSIPLSKLQQKKLYRESNDYYSLFNMATGKHSPFIYHKIQRFGASGKLFYWCYLVGGSTDLSGETIDVYDSLGVFVRTVCLDAVEEDDVSKFHDYYDDRFSSVSLITVMNYDGFSGVIRIDGERLLPNFFEGKLTIKSIENDSTGVLFAEGNGKCGFLNFRGEPILGGVIYDQYQNLVSIIQLRLGHQYTFATPEFKILLDSCTKPFNIEHNYLRKLKNTSYRHLLTSRNGYMYTLLENDNQFHLMDSNFFVPPAGIQEIGKGLYVDKSGRITTEQPESKPKTEQFLNIYLTLEKNNLKVESSKHELIQTLPNIVEYKEGPYFRGADHCVLVKTVDQKQGLISTTTGLWVIQPQYPNVTYSYGDGITFFWAKGTPQDSTHWLIIKQDGTPLTEAIFDDPFSFEYHKAWTYFRMNTMLGIINRELRVVSEPIFERSIKLHQKEVLLMKDKSCFLVDQATGKSFSFTHDIVNANFSKAHLFLFNDSIEIIALNGDVVLRPMKKTDAISTVNLVKYLYPESEGNPPSYISNHQIFVSNPDSALLRQSNEILLDNAKAEVISIADILKSGREAERKTPVCWREPFWINQYAYSERITGDCYNQPISSGLNRQKFSFRNYANEPAGLVALKLADLFKEDVNWTEQLDKLMEETIQKDQIFGTNCADVPGAIAEFKRNFYLERGYLTFFYYPTQRTIRIPVAKMATFLEHPEYF